MKIFGTLDFIDDREPRGAALNMAIDEVLLSGLRAPLLRVYRWARPSVSFGYFEKWEPVRAAHPQRELVRRWTGGGIVPHGDDFTYTLLVPANDSFFPMSAARSYCAIHSTLVDVLALSGVDATLAGRTATEDSHACFEKPVEYDLVANGKKIAGGAQRRTRFGLLHQGSVQFVRPGKLFSRQFAAALSHEVSERMLGKNEIAEAKQLAEKKYATDVWARKF